MISIDFRLANLVNGKNFACIPDNKLTIIDGNVTFDFNCSNINKFKIQELYVSKTNYIFLTYTGVNPGGGYLRLGLQSKCIIKVKRLVNVKEAMASMKPVVHSHCS